tara:strand:+ start:654 stop:995 length:342 start_codon:yes stop_codon:yes gene_type:complete
MAKVEISKLLFTEINTKFKHKSVIVLKHLKSLEENPHKGKMIGSVGGIIIKELKYRNFRFYFITEGFKLRCMDEKELVNLLIRFVRMSDKKHQQETINKIKHILRTIGPKGFE